MMSLAKTAKIKRVVKSEIANCTAIKLIIRVIVFCDIGSLKGFYFLNFCALSTPFRTSIFAVKLLFFLQRRRCS